MLEKGGDRMKKAFMCSLCHNGILGGGLYVDDSSLTYKTGKLTVEERYRNLVLPLAEIGTITWKWIFFPIATVHMLDGKAYTFIIFNKCGFLKSYAKAREGI